MKSIIPTLAKASKKHDELLLRSKSIIEEIYRSASADYKEYTQKNFDEEIEEISDLILTIETSLVRNFPLIKDGKSIVVDIHAIGDPFLHERLVALAKVCENKKLRWEVQVKDRELKISAKGCMYV